MSKEKIRDQITRLLPIVEKLKNISQLSEKLFYLNELSHMKEIPSFSTFASLLALCKGVKEEFVVKAIVAIGQAPIVFNLSSPTEVPEENFFSLLDHLIEVEEFYQDLGGVIGYHLNFISLILEQDNSYFSSSLNYTPPQGLNINQKNLKICNYIKKGISQLNRTAIFLPIGGAGDRLNLVDETTQTPLPAAVLPFLGLTLLEGLIRDLQSHEYLFYKLYHQRIHIPVALMTSKEKDNYQYVAEIIEKHNWFGRPKESFHFFMQPLVPVITEEGNWSLKQPLTLTLKPGGHGVIWKLAEDKGVLKKLMQQGYSQAFVRQINNPLANLDAALLTLIGVGGQHDKSFGFLSCERLLHSAEGANVLTEEKTAEGYAYCISNVEYTDFDRKSIGEVPLEENSPFSKYPSNTNILYVNIQAVKKALEVCSIPGTLINMKTVVPFIEADGTQREVKGGRLECTMQNIADFMQNEFCERLNNQEFLEHLNTFILFSDRIKTISTTKKSFKYGESPHGTPEQAYYDLQYNNRELFEKESGFTVPTLINFVEYLERGPNYLILYHPALGPLYSIISQKVRQGRLAENAELQLEIVEVDIQNLNLDGSLWIHSVDPLGIISCKDPLNYNAPGNCTLKNVTVCNKGINRKESNHYWKNQLVHHELVKIILHEGAEFHAENIEIYGSQTFEVPAYHRLTLNNQDSSNKIEMKLIPIQSPTWYWDYQFKDDGVIHLTRVEN